MAHEISLLFPLEHVSSFKKKIDPRYLTKNELIRFCLNSLPLPVPSFVNSLFTVHVYLMVNVHGPWRYPSRTA